MINHLIICLIMRAIVSTKVLVADEVCIAYPPESTHLRLFIAVLVTLLAVEMLPEE